MLKMFRNFGGILSEKGVLSPKFLNSRMMTDARMTDARNLMIDNRYSEKRR